MCAGQSGLLNGKVCRTDGFLAGLGPSVPQCSHTLQEGRIAPLPLPMHVIRGDYLECLAK